jgi:adenosylcobyric acid synthase
LAAEPDVALRYVASPKELHGADVIILPGSKTTMTDLNYLRNAGFEEVFMAHMHRGGEMMGVCGGFQMLGNTITDPQHVETGGSSKGFGLLDVETELLSQKSTVQVRAHSVSELWDHECLIEGYEIHMGTTTRAKTTPPCFRILPNHGQFSLNPGDERDEGAMQANGLVWGTYIHGVFDQPSFRREWLNRVRIRKNLQPLNIETSQAVSNRLVHAIDRWADHVGAYLDMRPIFSAIELRKDNGS